MNKETVTVKTKTRKITREVVMRTGNKPTVYCG